MIPRSVEAATHVVASSEHTKQDIIDALGCRDGKITVIPLPVLDLFRPVDDPARLARVRAKYRLPERFILFVGQLDPKKNIPTILRVFDALRKRGRPEKLVIAGKRGWREREVFRTLDELRLADDVVRTGYVELTDLPAVYTLARVLYFPSLYEGFGLPPLEAMACGTPVLASNAGSLPETVGDAAVLVDPLDAEKHVEELTKLLDDEALRGKMRSLGLARARAFRVEDFARRHLDLYHRLVGEASQT
jgi:glycosyltransferase involved in cell wall biosynthesis